MLPLSLPKSRCYQHGPYPTSRLMGIEEDIANSRKYYNAVVKLYNNKCQVFPSNIIGQMFNFKLRQMFQVDSEEERRNVKVSFNA